jgi:hypothetical protein
MTKREHLNNQLLEGLELLKYFNDDDFVRHIEINDIAISQFTLPKFNEDGTFIGGPAKFREEYIKFVQTALKGVTNPCLYVFELVSPDLDTVSKPLRTFPLNKIK